MATNALRLLDRRRVAYCLVVYGAPYRYCSHAVAPPFSAIPDGRLYDGASVAYDPPAVYDCVLEVGPIVAGCDDIKGVAAQEPVEVKLLAFQCPTDTGAIVDPIDVFGRVTSYSSSRRLVKLLTTLDHAAVGDAATVEVDHDVSGWDLPGPIYIGQETLWATAAAGDGSPGDPYRFTDCTRAADHHVAQEHAVSTANREQPRVTSDVCNWQGRRAAIFVTPLAPDGTAVKWSRYWDGFVDSAPESDGVTITLRIAPLSCVMSYTIGVGSAARTATAVAGWHRFDAGGPCAMADVRISWDVHLELVPYSAADVPTSTVTLTADGAARLDYLGEQLVLSVYFDDVGLVTDRAIDYTAGVLTFPAGSPLVAALDPAGGFIDGRGTVPQTHPLQIVDPAGAALQVVAWPDQLLTVANGTTFQTGPIASWTDPSDGGLEKRLATMSLVQQGASGYQLAVSCDTSVVRDFGTGTVAGFATGMRVSWCGFPLGRNIDQVRADWRGRATFQEGWTPIPDPVTECVARNDVPHAFDVDIPTWFYQPGELWIGPFDVDVYTGGGDPQRATVEGKDTSVTIYITGSETVDGLVYYSVHLPETAPAILMLPQDEPFTLQVAAGGVRANPMQYVAELLVSGTGNGDNGALDVMPIGANMPAALVDTAAFRAEPGPTPLREQLYEALRGKSITEQTEALMLACGVLVGMVYDEDYATSAGRWRIGLISMHPADASLSVLSITDADIIDGGDGRPVKRMVDGRTVRGFELTLNYLPGGDAPTPIVVAAATERANAQSDGGSPVKMDLPGVLIPGVGSQIEAAAEIVSDLRARTGIPRLRWDLRVPTSLPGVSMLNIGDVVTLTSRYAIGIDPTTRASNTPCRVVTIKRDLDAGVAELGLRPFPALVAGWAPSALVESVVSATEVQVVKNHFGLDDVTYFAAGDKVACVPVGDWAGRVHRTISSVNTTTRRIVFNAAHGLAVGDEVRWDDYSTDVATQLGYAFIADDENELPGGMPGVVLG